MYYMKNGIGGFLGKGLAFLFAVCGLISAFSMGSLVQMKAASDAARETFLFPPGLFGFLAGVLCVILLLGGYEKISRFTSVLIPVLSGIYLFMAARIVVLEWGRIPGLLREIAQDAFSFPAASGGTFAFLFSEALRQGVAKGSFSHEAGCGTAPMAHAGADTKIPAKQGLLGIFEVFFDTAVLCTLTGFVILLANDGGLLTGNGMHLVIFSFAKYYGKSAAYLISISVVCFALATVVCWGYYGKETLSYLTKSKTAALLYIIAYGIAAAWGAVMSESAVWEFADVTSAVMTVLNLSAVFWLRREVREETEAAGLCPPRIKR